MKTSIETINNKLCTVIWHKPDYIKQLLHTLDIPTRYGYEVGIGIEHIATILPALPRNPKPEDAALLYRYFSEGIAIVLERTGEFERGLQHYLSCVAWNETAESHGFTKWAVDRAIDAHGNRVDVAITDHNRIMYL